MTVLSDFSVTKPDCIEDAIAARTGHPDSRFIAGGTDLLVNMRHGLSNPGLLIDLCAIDALHGITSEGKEMRIGAGVTVAALAADPAIRTRYRAVAEAAEAIAGPGHRAMGTVGGNLCLDTRCVYYNQSEWWRHANGYCLKHRGDICHVAPQGKRCHAAFTGDLAPSLLVFGAEVEIAGPSGRRRMPLNELYVEDGQAHLRLERSEMLVAIYLPPTDLHSSYEKVRLRGAIDYPLAGVAAALSVEGTAVEILRIALTGTNSRPLALSGTEKLKGRKRDDSLMQDVDRLIQKQVQPMRTTVASSNYRRLAAAAVGRRLVDKLLAEAVN